VLCVFVESEVSAILRGACEEGIVFGCLRGALTTMSVCNILFVELLFLFGVFWGMCGESSCNVFLLLFMVLWVPIFVTLCRRAVLMLWHAFLFLGLRFSPLFFFFLGGLCCFFL
jgi:hypothetical protein